MSGTKRSQKKLKNRYKVWTRQLFEHPISMSLSYSHRISSLSKVVFQISPIRDLFNRSLWRRPGCLKAIPARDWRSFQMLHSQVKFWNLKCVLQIYCLLKLNFRGKGKKPLPIRLLPRLATPEVLNQSWTIDFMYDVLVCFRRFRTSTLWIILTARPQSSKLT